MKKSKCCSNCKYGKNKDLSIWHYHVKFVCSKDKFTEEDDEFYGDGDYVEDTTNRVLCEEFEYKPEEK